LEKTQEKNLVLFGGEWRVENSLRPTRGNSGREFSRERKIVSISEERKGVV